MPGQGELMPGQGELMPGQMPGCRYATAVRHILPK